MSSIDAVINSAPSDAVVSIWQAPLTGPATFAHGDEVEHYAASTIKVALVLAALREAEAGRLDLEERTPVHNDFRSQLDGSPFAMDRGEDSDPEPWGLIGDTASTRWLCRRAIVRSSNLATNLVFDRVGPTAIADALRICGTERTTMTRGIEDVAAREAGLTNSVTAADLGRLMQAIGTGQAASPESTRELLEILGAQEFTERIPAGLPSGVRVEHKTGSITQVCHDFGIIRPADSPPYVLSVCTSQAGPEESAARLIADIARALWDQRP